jgi:type IV fimbrial biogenesis protein FimT
MKTLRHIHGVTLVELMTTVSTLAVTLTLGVPTFNNIQGAMQRGQVAAEMLASFTLARSEAARRGVSVMVCASTTSTMGAICDTGSSPNWRSGWIVFIDTNKNHQRDTENKDEDIIHDAHFEHATFSLSSASAIAAGVAFRSSGYPNDIGTFRYCDAKEYRDLALNYIGRIEVTAAGSGCP